MVRALESVTAVSAGLLVIGYAITKPLYDNFYSPLGLSPEDVGQSQASMVTRGAENLAMISAFLVAVVAAVLLLRRLADSVLRDTNLVRHEGRRGAYALTLAVLVTAALATVAILFLPARYRMGAISLALAFALLATPTALWVFFRQREAHRAAGIMMLVALVSLGVIGYSFQFGLARARAAGRSFSRTGRVAEVWSVLLYVRATPVRLVELDKDPMQVCAQPATHLYLGGSNGGFYVMTLRDKTHTVARLAYGDYGVEFVNTPTCLGPAPGLRVAPSQPG